ncbi:glycosyltransferase [Microbacterium sp. ZW T5_56]|uniref:glycosyltransferase n=1 Tax=Microbacterium sp. ZW T5_56 TaxID=3378081 RepID=UPI00385213C5
MHIVFFGDQHVESSGGAQVSMRLQRQFLERAGHTVTVVVPRMHGRDFADPAYVELPSIPIQLDREYSMTWPGARTDAFVDRALAQRPAVDVVHVQADFWGAFVGHRFARRHGLPVVHTMHNRVDVGIQAVTPLAPVVLAALVRWQRWMLPSRDGTGVRENSPGDAGARDGARGPAGTGVSRESAGWRFLAGISAGSAAVTSPSAHFARRLEQHGVFRPVDVVWNGIDDAVLDAALATRAPRAAGLPRFVWVGRMSPEKRLLPFLEAVAESGIRAEVEIIGGGAQRRAAERLVARRAPRAHVGFLGRLAYRETLARLAAADAVVQTSVGFETQGMTPFEAAALGTPAIVSDPDIAAELESGFWPVAEPLSTSALAQALRAAADDISAGRAVAVNADIAERFRQSSRTAAMLGIYTRVVSA